MKLKCKVKINLESDFYNHGGVNLYNPVNTVGVVVELRPKFKYPIRVQWANGKCNCYRDIDLVKEGEQ